MFNKSKDPLQPINPLQPKGGTPAMGKDSYNYPYNYPYKEQTKILKAAIALVVLIVLSTISIPIFNKGRLASDYIKACTSKGGTMIVLQSKNETLCATFSPIDITTNDIASLPKQ